MYTSSLESSQLQPDQPELKEFHLFPNPAKENLSFQIPNDENLDDKSYFIYDLKGILVASGQSSGLVNISQLKPGNYIIKVLKGDQLMNSIFFKH